VKGMAKLRNTQVMKKLETTSNISCEMWFIVQFQIIENN
jgi:hypothetical protein